MEDEYSSGSQEAEREMARMWRTWKTVHEMLADRVLYWEELCQEMGVANRRLYFRVTRYRKTSYRFRTMILDRNTLILWDMSSRSPRTCRTWDSFVESV